MKQLLIAGNWKSNKTVAEAAAWMDRFKFEPNEHLTVVLCVPFTLLGFFASRKPPFSLGAQNVSPFEEGAFTGEVSARQIKENADWVIIGHSERRKFFGENDEMLQKKVTLAKQAGLRIIYCVPDEKTAVPPQVDVVAYEPVWAIGTGKTDTPQNANNVIAAIKSKTGATTVVYGGSVTAENVASFVKEQSIDGVLPGGASLDPEKFSKLIESALLS